MEKEIRDERFASHLGVHMRTTGKERSSAHLPRSTPSNQKWKAQMFLSFQVNTRGNLRTKSQCNRKRNILIACSTLPEYAPLRNKRESSFV